MNRCSSLFVRVHISKLPFYPKKKISHLCKKKKTATTTKKCNVKKTLCKKKLVKSTCKNLHSLTTRESLNKNENFFFCGSSSALTKAENRDERERNKIRQSSLIRVNRKLLYENSLQV